MVNKKFLKKKVFLMEYLKTKFCQKKKDVVPFAIQSQHTMCGFRNSRGIYVEWCVYSMKSSSHAAMRSGCVR